MSEGYYFNGNFITSHRKRPTLQPNLGLLGLLLLGFLLLAGWVVINKSQAKNLISPVGQAYPVLKNITDTPVLGELIRDNFNFNDEQLSKVILRRLENQPGEYAVVVEGLKEESKLKFYLNDHKVMEAASLYKLFLIAATYRAIEENRLTEDTTISVPEAHLIDILGSKEFGYDDVENSNITYSVGEMLNRIATVSDNYAAVMLAEKIGWDKIQTEANNIGAETTSIKSPITTTASDIALFYRQLYAGQVVSQPASDKIISLLSLARINDRIPDQLPEGLKIAHKTGELSKVRHDAGLVFLEGNPYLIILMSQHLEHEDDGVELFSNISKDVYEYFNANQR